MTWDIRILKNNVAKCYGNDQKNRLTKSLESIFENQDIARFHYAELMKMIEGHSQGKNKPQDYFRLVFCDDDEKLNVEYWFKVGCKAHIIALLRTLHCTADLLAHVLYYSLNLKERKSLSENQISWCKVKNILENDCKYRDLLTFANDLLECENILYLDALVNHTKHRHNITPKLNYSLVKTGLETYNFIFDSFSYKGITYPSREAIPFLHEAYDHQGKNLIDFGNKINHLVIKQTKNFSAN
ncbi:hypothetical protein R3X26_17760 [Vibrio sp. TH_r3]|uniref:hypothetical protein n=1 Tax=Vibrio sp. TH_r3 TaxID=3082084 RepID=UPI002954930F|nr:hypothetical protein [Vibrio sp. TH_r3]MDV7106246.1 hypothetical protein [Vibrio sp. TH_r3]